MRPYKLTLQGFTSFAERAEIDFSELDLFAITGPTGAGKTSILDAMTWALYGKTARLAKCGSELISHDKSSVAVHFEFTVGSERYRVVRNAKRKGAATVRFERFIDREWITDDAAGVIETNAAIERAVGLDFKSFNLSVILPQGKFSEFLSGEGTNRREILKSLLGHEIYDRMRDIAHRNCVDLSGKIAGHEDLLQRQFADATEDYLKSVEGELRHVKEAGEETATRLAAAEKLCSLADAITRERAALASNESDYTKQQAAFSKACDEAERKAEKANNLRRQSEVLQREHDGIVIDEGRAAELVRLVSRAEELARLVEQQNRAQDRRDQTNRELSTVETQHAESRDSLKAAEENYRDAQEAHLKCQCALAELTLRGSKDLLARLLEDVETLPIKLQTAGKITADIAAAAQKREELQTRITSLRVQQAAAETDLTAAQGREKDLARHALHRDLRAGLKPGEPCPVCEQTVSALPQVPAVGELEAAQRHVRDCEKNLQKVRDGIVRADTELAAIPRQLEQLERQRNGILAEVAAIRERVHKATGDLPDDACSRMLTGQINAIASAERELKAASASEAKAARQLRDAASRAAELETRSVQLATTLTGTTAELARLSEQVAGIRPEIDSAGGPDRIRLELEAVQVQRTKKAEVAATVRKVQSALAEADREKGEAENRVIALRERVQLLAANTAALQNSVSALASQWIEAIAGYDLPSAGNETDRAAKWRETAQKEHNEIRQRFSDLQARAKIIREKMDHRAEVEKQVVELRAELDIYKQIHTALFADRFIDYLLGRAYDDLCRRGSEHLLRLSSERYTFTAGKNTFNVKDGWNGDAERPANTLSGGESFFASLALALALAESVSTFGADGKEGARLEALFLDEGVSTLDQDESLPSVVDALMNLQAGDRMIGVISHMENLAQRLPARIEVVKNHGRSTIRINGYSNDAHAVAGLT